MPPFPGGSEGIIIDFKKKKSAKTTPPPIVVGTRMRWKDSVWVCTHLGKPAIYANQFNSKQATENAHEHFCTFFNDTQKVVDVSGVQFPYYDVFIVSSDPQTKPTLVGPTIIREIRKKMKEKGLMAKHVKRLEKGNLVVDSNGFVEMKTTWPDFLFVNSKVETVKNTKAAAAAAASAGGGSGSGVAAAPESDSSSSSSSSSSTTTPIKPKHKQTTLTVETSKVKAKTSSDAEPLSVPPSVVRFREIETLITQAFQPFVMKWIDESNKEGLEQYTEGVHGAFASMLKECDGDEAVLFSKLSSAMGEEGTNKLCQMLVFVLPAFKNATEQKLQKICSPGQSEDDGDPATPTSSGLQPGRWRCACGNENRSIEHLKCIKCKQNKPTVGPMTTLMEMTNEMTTPAAFGDESELMQVERS